MSDQQPAPPPWERPLTMDEDAIRYSEILNSFMKAGFTREEGIQFIGGLLNTATAESVRFQIAEYRRQRGY